jgi:phosphoribosylglycinamide formyltransferase-1
VDDGIDSGPIVLQNIVKVTNNDTEETLSKKILRKEHEVYPNAVELFAKKKISIKGKSVKILN